MNLLRNPWVTAALVFAALLLVFFRIPGLFGVKSSSTPASATGLAAAVPAASPSASSIKPAADKADAIENNLVMAQLDQWLTAPRRDPFHAEAATIRQISEASASPLAQWKLKGIWSQTGGRAVAINNGVYGEGDRIGDYQLERIGENQVWLRGPAGLEHLDFAKGSPEATNKSTHAAGSERSQVSVKSAGSAAPE